MQRLTVVITAYNTEKYIGDCINSVLAQTQKPHQIILVNNGSTDSTLKILKEFSEKNSIIEIIDKDNDGPSGARNAGIEKAAGDLIAFVDGDDIIDSNMYKTLIEHMEKTDCDVVYCTCKRFFNDDLSTQSVRHIKQVSCENPKDIGKEMILPVISNFNAGVEVSGSACMSVYKKDIIDKFSLRFKSMEEIFSEDNLFNIEYLAKCKKAAALDLPLYYYRKTPGSATGTLQAYTLSALQNFGRQTEKICLELGIEKAETEKRNTARYLDALSAFIKKKTDISSLKEAKEFFALCAKDKYTKDCIKAVKVGQNKPQVVIFAKLLRFRLFTILYILIKIYSKFIEK